MRREREGVALLLLTDCLMGTLRMRYSGTSWTTGVWLVAGAMMLGGRALGQGGAPVGAQPGGPVVVPPQQLHPVGSPKQAIPALPPKPKEPPSPLDGAGDVRAMIEGAKQRATTRGVRVLTIWASGPKEETTRLFVEMTETNDMRRLLGMEFETVWAECGKSERGAANREVAKSFEVEVKEADAHSMLAVLDGSGKVLGSKSAEEMVDAERGRAYSVLKLQDFLNPLKAPAPVAKELFSGALARAKESKRVVLATFGEFGDEWSVAFTKWLTQPEVARAIGAYAVVTPIELLRDKKGTDLMVELGGVHVQSLPWFVFVGGDGKPIVASQTEKVPNIGFPTDDGEIGVLLGMLKQAAPGIKEEDSAAIRASLVEHRTGKK